MKIDIQMDRQMDRQIARHLARQIARQNTSGTYSQMNTSGISKIMKEF